MARLVPVLVLLAVVGLGLGLTKEEATAEGLSYFAGRCKDQQVLLQDLKTALDTGDLGKSKNAYVKSRPPIRRD